MICCGSGSGSDFEKVWVPVPAPVLTPTQNLAFSLSKDAYFPESLLHFMLDPDSNLVPESDPDPES
jgi:hypothetical protein